MPPRIFEFTHLLVFITGILIVLILRNIGRRNTNKLITFTVSSLRGAIIGVMASYLLAHMAAPLLKSMSTNNAMGGTSYQFMFWSLFVAFSFIGLITGGLLGIILAKKGEDLQESSDESIPGQYSRHCARDLDRCLDDLEQCAEKNKNPHWVSDSWKSRNLPVGEPSGDDNGENLMD